MTNNKNLHIFEDFAVNRKRHLKKIFRISLDGQYANKYDIYLTSLKFKLLQYTIANNQLRKGNFMATQKQIKANRKNAQKSTGPKTDEGKAAVSQNAVKHGLFAQSVIYGENQAEYEAFHDNFLADHAPVVAMELFLAERAANLAWRLKRAERMQNEVIEDMIGRKVTTNPARRARESYYYNQGRRPDEPGVDLDDLPLGRIATIDFGYCRVLDRMLMYERRIENSLHKTLRELERRQLIRQFKQQEAEQELSRQETNQLAENNSDLKKRNISLRCHSWWKVW